MAGIPALPPADDSPPNLVRTLLSVLRSSMNVVCSYLSRQFPSRREGGWWQAVAAALLLAGQGLAQPAAAVEEARVGVPTDQYPVSFLDEKGHLAGYAVDVLRQVAATAGLQIKELPLTTVEMDARFVAHDLDVRLFVSQSHTLAGQGISSVPYVDLEGAIFARQGDRRVLSVDTPALKMARIATTSGWGRKYALRNGVPGNQVLVLNPEEALRQVDQGNCDVALMPRLIGLAAMAHLRLASVEPVASLPKDFGQRCGFSVLRGKEALLARLNDGVFALQGNGGLLAIRHQWFGAFEMRHYDRQQITAAVAAGLAIILVLALWGLIRQRWLRQTLARQAEELRQHQAILAVAQRMASVGHWQRHLDDTDVMVCSAELCRIAGVKPAEVEMTMTWFLGAVHPEDRSALRQALAAAQRNGKPFTLVHRLVRPTGEERIVEQCVQLFADAATGRSQSMVGTVQDVTERKRAEKERQHQERVLHEAGQIAKVGGWSFDPLTGEGHWTPEVARIHGMSPEQPITRDLGLSFFQGSHRARIEAATKQAIEHGTPYDLELEMISAQGEFKWVRTICNPVVENGVVTRIRGCFQDITDRKRTEAALQESHDLLAKLSAQVPGLIYRFKMTPEGQTSMPFVSSSIETIAEITPDQVRDDASPAFACIHPDDAARVAAAIGDSARDMTRFCCEYRVVLPVKGLRWHYADSQPEPAEDGCILWHGYIADVTERKLAETRITEQAALLDRAQDAIVVRDLQHQVLFWNQGAVRLYGWSQEEAMHRPITEMLYSGDTTPLLHATQHVINHGEWSGELVQQARDGRELTVEARWSLVRDDHGRPQSILSINTDVTDKKRLEAQFLRAQRLESIGTLAGGVAHDLNNVLAPITLAVSLLRVRITDPMMLKTLDLVEGSVKRGASVVSQILGFARGTKVERAPMRIEDVVSQQVEICRSTFPKSITVRHDLAERGWMLHGDATQLAQVVMNLCVNALDAMSGEGILTMTVKNHWLDATSLAHHPGVSPGPYVVLEVADTGTGIPPDLMARIFDPFFTSKDIGRGSGLGLSTVLAIVRGHGGFVDVTSQVGRGTTFQVTLPAAPAESPEASGPPEPAADTTPRGNGETLLLVDDEPPLRELIAELLTEQGYQVLTAGNGIEAVAVFAREHERISLVITDMAMPLMDGESAIRAIRRISPLMPIIAISGNRAATVARITTDLHFLPKPFASDVLLRLIGRLLRAKD